MARHAALWCLACLPLATAVRRQVTAPPSFLPRVVLSTRNATGTTPSSNVDNLNVTSKQNDPVMEKVSKATENVTDKAKQPGLPGLFGSMHQRCDAMAMYPPKPEVCTQGGTWNKTDLIEGLNYFVHMWRVYQDKFSHLCCTGVNHLFPIFFVSGTDQPPAIIQAGVSSGQMTWWLRTAVPNAQIFAVERIDPEMVYSGLTDVWLDTSPKTKYFTGHNFVDVLEADWETLIPDAGVRAKTLVILSDHRSGIEQFKVLKGKGFRKFLYMDNYPYEISTSADSHTCKDLAMEKRDWPIKHLYGDAYTPSAICDRKLAPNTTQVVYKDKAGKSCRQISYAEHMSNVAWMQQNAAKYYEFPPVYTTCEGRWEVDVARQPLLHTVEMPAMFPQPEYEVLKYGHLFPAYIELGTPGSAAIPAVGTDTGAQLGPPPDIELEPINDTKTKVEPVVQSY